MEYRLPSLADEQALKQYIKEHFDNGEYSISASFGLANSEITEWIERINNNATNGDLQLGRSLLYLCFDSEELIGLLNIRYELPLEFRNKYGDVGYGVKPTKRNFGYATEMLKYALMVCKQKGMQEIIVGCYKDNLSSASVIKKNGGILLTENDNYHKGRISQYYSIKI